MWKQSGLCAEGHLTAMTVAQKSGQPKAPCRKGAGAVSTPTSFSSLPPIPPRAPIGQTQLEASGHRSLRSCPFRSASQDAEQGGKGEQMWRGKQTIQHNPHGSCSQGHRICWGRQHLCRELNHEAECSKCFNTGKSSHWEKGIGKGFLQLDPEG